MLEFLKRLFSRGTPDRGPSLPLDLARRGWHPYKFPDSNVVVFLPPPSKMVAAFDAEGVLYGSTGPKELEFSATLHAGGDFDDDKTMALGFVDHLAAQRGLKTRDKGTYRFFYDPTDADPRSPDHRFWVVGIPGAVVVISIIAEKNGPSSPVLREVWDEIPQIVGELL